MARRKTTLSLDEDLLRAIKIAAAREDKPEYRIVEDALRAHLGLDVFERVWARLGEGMDEDDAMALAYLELKALRRERGRKRAKGA